MHTAMELWLVMSGLLAVYHLVPALEQGNAIQVGMLLRFVM